MLNISFCFIVIYLIKDCFFVSTVSIALTIVEPEITKIKSLSWKNSPFKETDICTNKCNKI